MYNKILKIYNVKTQPKYNGIWGNLFRILFTTTVGRLIVLYLLDIILPVNERNLNLIKINCQVKRMLERKQAPVESKCTNQITCLPTKTFFTIYEQKSNNLGYFICCVRCCIYKHATQKYTHSKTTSGFLTFTGDIEMKHFPEIG